MSSSDFSSTSSLSSPASSAMLSSEFEYILKDLFAGTISGSCGILVGAPMDTIKVRLQAENAVGRNTMSALATTHYNGTFDCLKQMVHKEGVLSLFKGVSAPIIASAPINAILFTAYGNMIRTLENKFGFDKSTHNITSSSNPAASSHLTTIFLAGAWAGILQSSITSPTELIKCRLQVAITQSKLSTNGIQPTNPTSLSVLRSLYHTSGLRGIYRGLTITIARDAPASGVYFASYEWLKRLFTSMQGKRNSNDTQWEDPIQTDHLHHTSHKQLNTPINSTASSATTPLESASLVSMLLAGGFAGALSWLVVYPIDVIKSNIQTLPDRTPKPQRKILYVARHMYQQQGMAAFFKGLSVTMIRSFPVNAITFLGYEYLLKIMG